MRTIAFIGCLAIFLKNAWRSLAVILLYYFFSISLTFYNKSVIMDYQFPLMFTSVHLVCKFLISWFVRNILECKTHQQRVILPWDVYSKQLSLTGILGSLDIGLSNWSFSFITVSLYTMTKTSALVFVLIFGLLLGVEKFRWLQLVVVLCISCGLLLFTYESTQFRIEGFLLCLAAAFSSGFRWSLTQLLAQKNELGLSNPVDLMYHVQPWMMLLLLPVAISQEGSRFVSSEGFFRYSDGSLLAFNVGMMVGGALLAFGLEFSEFLLVSQSSSLTLSISAMFKELCVLLLAEKVYGDKLTGLNKAGLAVCLIGISVHIVLKSRSNNAEHRMYTRYASRCEDASKLKPTDA